MRENTPMTVSATEEASLLASTRTLESGTHEGLRKDRESDGRARGRLAASAPEEESLVIDDRSGLTPAQMVESKLMSLLQGATLPVSHLQMRGLLRGRH